MTMIAALLLLAIHEMKLVQNSQDEDEAAVGENTAREAMLVRRDTIEIMVALAKNPSTKRKHWKKILPICRLADFYFYSAHPYLPLAICPPLEVIVLRCR